MACIASKDNVCVLAEPHGENGALMAKFVCDQMMHFLPEVKVDSTRDFENLFSIIDDLLCDHVCKIFTATKDRNGVPISSSGRIISGGAVVTAIIRYPTRIVVVNVGNARAYVFSGHMDKIHITKCTTDHVPESEKEQRRLQTAPVNLNLPITRAFGDFAEKQVGVTVTPDMHIILLSTLPSKKSCAFIASDSVHECFTKEEMATLVLSEKTDDELLAIFTQRRKQLFPEGDKDGTSFIRCPLEPFNEKVNPRPQEVEPEPR
jgi:serine/threonine protein phosphatase PrpC